MVNSWEQLVETRVERQCGGQRCKGLLTKGSPGQPLVTVITAVLNSHQSMARCLQSVLNQDYPNIEHLVFDGASTDGTVDVLRKYDDKIALWRSEPDRGVYDAWNKALLEAHGEWICFLGADDEFLPGAVGKYMALAASNPQAEFLSSKFRLILGSGYVRTLGSPWTWEKFSRTMCTGHAGTMHRRSLFDRLGTYDTSYRVVGDYELLLRARHQLNVAYMDVITVSMRDGGVSRTRKALAERAVAQVTTGGRNRAVTAIDLFIANAKYFLRPLRQAVGGLFTRSMHLFRSTAS